MIATITSLVITPLIRRLCERFQLLDVPGDNHQVIERRSQGWEVWLFIFRVAWHFQRGRLSIISLLKHSANRHRICFLALCRATLVFLLGVYDDLRGTNAVVKFVALGLIASLFLPWAEE